MRTVLGVVMLALPATALAQPGMTPYYAQPPPAAVTPAPVEPKVRLELSLIAASPKGDWEKGEQLGDAGADTSGGLGIQVGFTVAPNISLFGGLRYIKVELADNGQVPQDFELSHRELQVGMRYTSPVAPAAKLFLEGNIHSAKLEASFQGDSQSESGMGFGGRLGLIFMADSKIGLGVAGSYSSSNITADGTEIDDAWLAGDLFVSAWF